MVSILAAAFLHLFLGILVDMALCTGYKKAEEEEGTAGSPRQRFSLQVSSSFFFISI
jgi:hypothetical protein